jgi:hypothetical protein
MAEADEAKNVSAAHGATFKRNDLHRRILIVLLGILCHVCSHTPVSHNSTAFLQSSCNFF